MSETPPREALGNLLQRLVWIAPDDVRAIEILVAECLARHGEETRRHILELIRPRAH